MATYVEYTRDLKGRVTGISWYDSDPNPSSGDPPAATKVMGIFYGATNDMIEKVIISEGAIEISHVEYSYDSDGLLIEKKIVV